MNQFDGKRGCYRRLRRVRNMDFPRLRRGGRADLFVGQPRRRAGASAFKAAGRWAYLARH